MYKTSFLALTLLTSFSYAPLSHAKFSNKALGLLTTVSGIYGLVKTRQHRTQINTLSTKTSLQENYPWVDASLQATEDILEQAATAMTYAKNTLESNRKKDSLVKAIDELTGAIKKNSNVVEAQKPSTQIEPSQSSNSSESHTAPAQPEIHKASDIVS